MNCVLCNVALYHLTCPVCQSDRGPYEFTDDDYMVGIPEYDYGQSMIDAYEAQARDDAAREHFGETDPNAYYAWKACE